MVRPPQRWEEKMKKTWISKVLLIGTAMLGAVALSGTNAMAGDVTMDVTAVVNSTLTETVTTNLNFGTIDLVPQGDVIRINASGGAATATATGTSLITGSTSGLITVSATAGAFTIGITYPAGPILLTGIASGDTVNLTAIAANSTATGVAKVANVDAVIHVGGVVTFLAGTEDDTYEGTITITLNYT